MGTTIKPDDVEPTGSRRVRIAGGRVVTPPRFIRHVSLNTGHVRDFWREEVAPSVVELLRPLIEQAVASDGSVDLPYVFEPRCTITAACFRDHGLHLTVWAPPRNGAAVPLVTLGVAPSSRAGATMWFVLCPGGGEEQEPAAPPPAAPWCAVRLEPGRAWHPEAASWLEDLVPCIAWAWVEATR